MNFNKNLIDEFLEVVFPLPDEFGMVCYCDEAEEPVEFYTFKSNIKAVDIDASVDFGMSKIVISSPHLNNVVIKIPFNGYYNDDDDGGGLYWNNFQWASGSDKQDYCLAEFEKYKKLKTYNLDCFVAKTFLYKIINGVRIFLQEYVTPECNSCESHQASKKSQDIASKWWSEGKIPINTEWVANCLDKYGKSKVERFLYYCSNIDLDILEDTHSGNYGYRSNGTPCLLDFSSFKE